MSASLLEIESLSVELPTERGPLRAVCDISLSLGMTVVMVTHERALADRFAQRFIFLADGKLVSEEVRA